MPPLPEGRFFHLLTATGHATRGPAPFVAVDQFERHGFVHCCFREQLTEIATWWFDADDDLVALELDPVRLTPELRLEASPTRWYPHLYGPIDVDAIVTTHLFPAAPKRRLPSALAAPPPGYQLTGVVDGRHQTVRWHADASLQGDTTWIARAEAAIADGLTVELLGGIVVPATLDRAYESFALLEAVTDGGVIGRYDGDGFFES